VYSISVNVWYDVKITYYGTTFKWYVNNTLQVTATDNTISTGGVGVAAYDGSVYFDEIKVRKYVEPEPVICSECIVTNTNNSGSSSLRDCINQANSDAVPTNILFNIEDSDAGRIVGPNNEEWWRITLTEPLPSLTENNTYISGNSQADFQGGDVNPYGPEIEIYGQSAGSGNGLAITGNYNKIEGLIIDSFELSGIKIEGNNNTIVGCYIGVNYNGTTAKPNGWNQIGGDGHGIYILGGGNNTIGGSSENERNIISGNVGDGIRISYAGASNNKVIGNYIGVNREGEEAIGNQESGVSILWNNNTIGGSNSGERNVISGNEEEGIYIGGSNAIENIVIGNYIGVGSDGETAIPNQRRGVLIYSEANNNRIGGTTASERNIISGNEDAGVQISGDAYQNYVLGNYIGITQSGNERCSNDRGIVIQNGANNNIIGSDGSNIYGNVISGNSREGIRIASGPGNKVIGNYVGISADGSKAIGNGGDGGVNISGDENVVGGINSSERNVISGNNTHGIFIGGNNNKAIGNYIGITPTGGDFIPNEGNGIRIYTGAQSNVIGGVTSDSTNVIAGNEGAGVYIEGSTTMYNRVNRNSIYKNISLGIDLTGSSNENIQAPTINSVTKTASSTYEVEITVSTPTGSRVEVFTDENGEGKNYKTSYTTTTDNETFTVTITENERKLYVTATVTNPNLSTSEFSNPYPLEGDLIVTTTSDVVDGNVSSVTALNTNKGSDGHISLREAILATNNTTGKNVIHFNIPQTDNGYNSTNGVWVISLGEKLELTDDDGVIIDGYTQELNQGDRNSNGPDIVINGSGISGTPSGIIEIQSSSYNIIKGLTIQGGGGSDGGDGISGIYFYYGHHNEIYGCYIGTNYNGEQAVGNKYGVYIRVGDYNTVGNLETGKGNLISGNYYGIFLEHTENDHNEIINNYIGTNRTGSSSIPNNIGIYIDASEYNLIGGEHPNARNVVSGNTSHGIYVHHGEAVHTQIVNNYIGITSSGEGALGNEGNGIYIHATPNCVVKGNVISGNSLRGITVYHNDAQSAQIIGNLIGTDRDGETAIPNGSDGIYIYNAKNTTIGGETEDKRNVISGNTQHGIYLEFSDVLNTQIIGNYIGVNKSGNSGIGNGECGIYIYDSRNNVIRENVISDNGSIGICFARVYADGNSIFKNYIGVGADGSTALGNGGHGVYVYGAQSITIGGEGNENIIANNQGAGVWVREEWADYVKISRNSMYNNQDLGIDIGTYGEGHGSAGANEDVNSPTITNVTPQGGGYYLVEGTVSSPGEIIEVFLNQEGEGEVYLATTTTSSSNWSVTIYSANAGYIVATATTGNGSTSEFSAPFPFSTKEVKITTEVKEDRVILRWTPVEEGEGFVIKRDEKIIGEIPFNGFVEHKFVDSTVVPGREYLYKLSKIMNQDTIFVAQVRAKIKEKIYKFKLKKISPSVNNKEIKIEYEVPGRKKKKVNLCIYNGVGRVVMRLVNNEYQVPGKYNLSVKSKKFTPGVYFLYLEIEEKRTSKKFIIF
jgi:parallel beta-helix repeat protein